MKALEQGPEPLQDLIDDYLSGLLDESRTQELEALLRGDAAARAYFVRYARLHTDLILDTRARRAGDRALGTLTQAAVPSPGVLRGWFALSRLTVAAVVLIAAGAGWWLWSRPAAHGAPEPAVAWLVNAQNCQWQDTEPAGPMRLARSCTSSAAWRKYASSAGTVSSSKGRRDWNCFRVTAPVCCAAD